MRPTFLFLVLLSSLCRAESGSPDASFGTGGLSVTSVVSGDDFARGAALQKNGRIVSAGEAMVGSTLDFAVTRHLSNGALDPSFNGGGSATVAVGPGHDRAFAVLVQKDQKIVAVGSSVVSGQSRIALARFLPNGTLDPSFGTSGIVVTGRAGWWFVGYAIARQRDGKILVAAQGVYLATNQYQLMVVRYLADGSLDPSFGTGGISEQPLTGVFPHAIVVGSNGRILVAGHYLTGPDYRACVARYQANGSPDTSFGTNGIVTVQVPISIFNKLILERSGRFYAAGGGTFSGQEKFVLVHFRQDGQFDPSFGSAGIATAAIGTQAQAYGAAYYRRGIVLGGQAQIGGESRFAFARFRLDGSLDSSFGSGGTATVAVGNAGDSGAYGLVFDRQRHNLVAAGRAKSGSSQDFALVGLNP